MQDWQAALTAQADQLTLGAGARSLRLYRWGEGPVVLLVHGWNGWVAQLGSFIEPLLAAGYQVVGFDAPGHGASGGSSSSLVEFADAFELVVDAVRPFFQSIHGVIAHSMGASAVAFALSRERSRLGAHEGALRGGALERSRLVFVAPPLDIRELSAQFSDMLGLRRATRRALDDAVDRAIGEPLHAEQALERARGMRQPLLLLHDADDRAVPLADSQRWVGAWPGAELHVTRGLGHARVLHDSGTVQHALDFIRDKPIAAREEPRP